MWPLGVCIHQRFTNHESTNFRNKIHSKHIIYVIVQSLLYTVYQRESKNIFGSLKDVCMILTKY